MEQFKLPCRTSRTMAGRAESPGSHHKRRVKVVVTIVVVVAVWRPSFVRCKTPAKYKKSGPTEYGWDEVGGIARQQQIL